MSIFTKTNLKRPTYSTFDLKFDNKFSCNPGELVPILVQDCLPGDKFSIKPSALIRFAPLVAPIMHRVNAKMDFFFVPNRIMWDNWEDFITGGEDGDASPVFPTIKIFGKAPADFPTNALIPAPGTLLDYLGYPVMNLDDDTGINASAFPYAAYFKIWDDYYRDQNLQDPVSQDLQDGDNVSFVDHNKPLRRAWQHDYFTSCLPEPQKGPAATIPIGESAPITRLDNDQDDIKFVDQITGTVTPTPLYQMGTPPVGAPTGDLFIDADGDMAHNENAYKVSPDVSKNHSVNMSNWVTDLSSATAALITDLRRAFRLQEWLEKNARGGSRYFESNLVHFNVKSPDARLQRPEFIGSVTQPVQISEVLQTSSTDATSPQGNMSGHAISANTGKSMSYYCQEHGYIIGLLSVRPETAYFQGLPRHLTKFDKFDYAWPEFANIGEQAVLNKEINVLHSDPDGVFGYIPRYAEYKFRNSEIHGDFKDSLFFWHWTTPQPPDVALNSNFIECTPTNNPFAVTDNQEHKLWCHIFFNIRASRALPYFGNPTI